MSPTSEMKRFMLSSKDKLDIIYILKKVGLDFFLSNKYGVTFILVSIIRIFCYPGYLDPRLVQVIEVLLYSIQAFILYELVMKFRNFFFRNIFEK